MHRFSALRALLRSGLLLGTFSLLSFRAHGAAGDVDLSLDPGSGLDGAVGALAVQPDGSGDGVFDPGTGGSAVVLQADGRVLVGGRFSIGEDPGSFSLVRLNADKSLHGGFRHGYSEELVGIEVRCVSPRDDGRILVAGALMGVDGVVAETVQRLDAEGSVDASFDTGPGVSIYTASTNGCGNAWQPDGKAIASGYYRPEAGVYYGGPIRLNVDGSLDRRFGFETGYFRGNHCLELQADGNVLVGGLFLKIRGVLRPHIARLSGNPRSPIPYAAWVAGFGLSGAVAAADADPDHDGAKTPPNRFSAAIHPWSLQPGDQWSASSVAICFSHLPATTCRRLRVPSWPSRSAPIS